MFCFPCELAQTTSEQVWANSGRSLGHRDPKLQIWALTDLSSIQNLKSHATHRYFNGDTQDFPSVTKMSWQDVWNWQGKQADVVLLQPRSDFWTKYKIQICRKVLYQIMPRGMCRAVSAHPDWCYASLLLPNLYSCIPRGADKVSSKFSSSHQERRVFLHLCITSLQCSKGTCIRSFHQSSLNCTSTDWFLSPILSKAQH